MPAFLYFVALLLMLGGGVGALPALAGRGGPGAFSLVLGAWMTALFLAALASIANRLGDQAETQRQILTTLQDLRAALPSRRAGANEPTADADETPPEKAPEEMTYPELVAHAKKNAARYRTPGR